MGVAVITGAGSGMGRATAELYLDRDWQVIAVDISEKPWFGICELALG